MSEEHQVELAVMANKIDHIESNVRDIKEALQEKYVTQDQFEPIKRIVYGMVAIVLTGVIGAIIGLVLI